MASVEELREKVNNLQKKLAEMESFTVSSKTGKADVMQPGGSGRGASPGARPTGKFVNVSTTSVEKNKEYDKTLNDLLTAQTQLQDAIYSREGTYNTLAEQIGALAGGVRTPENIGAFNQAVAALGGSRNYAASDLGTRLNFQVSDQQIIDDYNTSRLNRLNIIAQDGSAQIAGIQSRLQAANKLLSSLPSGDPRRTSAQVSIDQLSSDLASVQGAVTKANEVGGGVCV